MDYDNFLKFLSDKRTKINYMHQISKKIIDDNYPTTQYEVLLRGYIVLIYSFWEGAYKALPEYFCFSLREKSVDELPFKLKNKIICSKLEGLKKNEVTNHQSCLRRLENEIKSLKKQKVKEKQNIIQFFSNHSNNPNIEKLKELLKLYHIKLEIETELENKIKFIINSRNDIAHAGLEDKNYHTEIQNYFNLQSESNFEKEEVLNILQDILLDLFTLYKKIIDIFREKNYA